MKAMRAASQESVLIEQVVYCGSVARQATGQDPLFDIPKGDSTSNQCPIARLLNLNCSVTGATIRFQFEGDASAVANALGLTVRGNDPRTVVVPSLHPFRAFITRFDGRNASDKRLRALRLSQ